MILNVTLGSNDLIRSRAFYDPVLATLGIALLREDEFELGYGPPGAADPALWITQPFDRQPATHGNGTMLALTAPTRAAVDAFHRAGLASGGSDEGEPGPRYENFYCCYIRDPDGNKLSAVCETAD